jgi:hypothetical protein
VFFKNGGTALELCHCRTASCDLFLCSEGLKTSEAYDLQTSEDYCIFGQMKEALLGQRFATCD